MDHMLYVAMSGAKQTMRAQAVNANNLANVNTTGFRADLLEVTSYAVKGDGWDSRIMSTSNSANVDLNPGSIMTTGRELDIALKGEGWIAVQSAEGGEALTRSGELKITSGGLLVTGAGYPVLGNSGVITIPPAEKVEIAGDGTISIRPVGQTAAALAVVDRIRLVSVPSENLRKGSDGLMHTRNGDSADVDARIQLVSGAIESSNVNAVGSMVDMITLARQFEIQIKMMKSAEENDAAATALMRMNG
ncbi:MAG: flagellar basal-body rod protein FlgF [Gammaproteobacteria bacterium]|nr:flagellar basal-body rod protein FlgF [Gammaproteobacteria bacterium]